MSPLIDDALKATRTLHRLIMTVSLVTLVFAFSLDLPRDKVAQKDALEALINSDFLAYDEFVAEKVDAFRQQTLVPIGTALNERLQSGRHLIFNLDDLGEAFSEPLHIGKLLTEELAIADLTGATLTSLEALNSLGLSRDVQVVVPQTDELIPEIERFLESHPAAGRRIAEIRLTIDDFPFAAESFLPGSDTIAGIYFELVDAVRTGAAPTFSANFPANIVTLPNSSFLHWVTMNSQLTDVVSIDGNKIDFAPALKNAPTGFREQKLGPLYQRLTDEIAQSGPEKQSATILGTQVPGVLVVIAAPLTLLVLSYYFSNHTLHLARLARSEAEAFQNFAWMPLAMRNEIRLFGWRQGDQHVTLTISSWLLEALASVIGLPVASLLILYWQLNQFGEIGVWASAAILAGAIGALGFGLLSLRSIAALRRVLTDI